MVYLKSETLKNELDLKFYNSDDINKVNNNDNKYQIPKLEVDVDIEKIEEILEWKYNYEKSTLIPLKTSVSKLKQNSENIEELFSEKIIGLNKVVPDFENDKNISASQIGTIMHNILQYIDFNKDYTFESLTEFINDLILANKFTKEEVKYINKKKILNFLNSNIGLQIKKAKQVCKETPFCTKVDAKKFFDAYDKDYVLVQGIIDLYFVDENGKIILVDYKTDYEFNEEVLKQMIESGMTGMRLNLSHMSLPDAGEYIDNYKKAALSLNKDMQILIDMQGPELRVGDMADKMLDVGSVYALGDDIPVPDAVISSVCEGDELLFDDGKILCRVTGEKELTVIRGGVLSAHKSVKVKGKDIKMPCLTEHDVENIKLARDYGVTAIMQPFVRSGEDLHFVRETLDKNGARELKIFAKLENMAGVENIGDIAPYSDCIIIARGDLGNDMPLWELPAVQKRIEDKCKEKGIPYIVVTQMLASMEHSPVPTRAEVSDIFHAVYNGAYGVMITGESAVGEYPVEAVKYLSNTAREAVLFLKKE